MTGRRHRAIRALAVLVLAACGGEASSGLSSGDAADSQVAQSDALPPVHDTRATDTADTADTTLSEVADGGPTPDPDVAAPKGTSLFGHVEGACGVVGAEVPSGSPAFLENVYVFDAAFDAGALTGKRADRFESENAGGSSKCSELMSMQLLVDCEGATIHALEVDVSYESPGALTDYVALIAGEKVGVSVTRAYLGPFATEYSAEQASELLSKKLLGVLESSANVSPDDAWKKQLLHVWTLRSDWVPMLQQAWSALPADVRADTVVLVTVEQGSESIVTDACDD